MVQNHPFPIGGRNNPDTDSHEAKLRKFYKYPNVILALYIHHVMKAYEENRLEAFQSQLGTVETGYHWIVFTQGCQTSKREVYVCGVGDIILARRLAGFANSVVLGYHQIISDDDGEYIVDGRRMPLGFEFMSNRAHTHHLHCFKSERTGQVCANTCIALVNHLACSDSLVNCMVSKK